MTPDLVAEHQALLVERGELWKLCLNEWPMMSLQTARARNARLLTIADRLRAIEKTSAWKGRRQ